MVEVNAVTLLVGEDRGRSVRYLGLAIVSSLVAILTATIGHYALTSVLGIVGRVFMVTVPIFCLIAAYQAYRNQGLAVSITLVFAPLFGMISHGFGVGIFSEPTPLEWFLMGIRIGGGVALVLGTGMFLTGMAARLISDWNQTRKKNPEQAA